MEQFIDQMMRIVGDYLPALIGALLILVLGSANCLVWSTQVAKSCDHR